MLFPYSSRYLNPFQNQKKQPDITWEKKFFTLDGGEYVDMKKLKMKNKIFFCLCTCAMPVCSLFSATNIDYTSEDSVIFERVQTWKKTHHDNTCADIGDFFLGAPYVAKTLDQNNDERLVVNLRQFDCSTFVESVLALWLLPDNASFADYCNQLTAIRYRNGKCDGYCSRLHYFSDWIADNEAKSFVNN